ncbi:hypothetical protein BGZ93_006696 [Podila epicladia]|nr:hypothetical protein BGZ92_006098 [Podila epicladia]KAG0094839.1 hypothetical protein BGZ93_006696 [Podila epicladia]
MEFSFALPTVTSSGTPLQPPPAFSFQAQGTGQGAFTFTSTGTAAHPSHDQSLLPLGESQADDSYGRVAQTRAHGVGDTKQWRQRILSHIEDRVKDKRISIQNSRRAGLNGSSAQEHHSHTHVNSSTGSQLDLQRAASQEGLSFSQLSHASSTGSDEITPEEERRIVAEVWEAFKNENFAAFQALTDAEVEDIEGEIMRLKHDYDPTYDVMLDVEQDDMQESYDHYMLLERCAALERENAEMASALSLSITILSGATCFRCRQGTFSFEPITTQGGTGTGSTLTSGTQVVRAGCRVCGLCLEDPMLVYIANAARSHSRTCSSQLLFDYDLDTGLLVLCSACDFMA